MAANHSDASRCARPERLNSDRLDGDAWRDAVLGVVGTLAASSPM